MIKNERITIAIILLTIFVLTFIDIYNDYFEGVATWHISIESVVALIALSGVYYLIRGRFTLMRMLAREHQFSDELQVEVQKWKRLSKTYLEGLSIEMDKQLTRWNLTKAEKDVVFLLIKGLSIKEIAEVRNTSVKTVRTQTNAIYSKSGLSGRSGLSAFFLEDLLLPRQ